MKALGLKVMFRRCPLQIFLHPRLSQMRSEQHCVGDSGGWWVGFCRLLISRTFLTHGVSLELRWVVVVVVVVGWVKLKQSANAR